MRTLFCVILSLMFLGGCATTGAPIQRANVFDVKVVSLIGTSIDVAYQGITVFGNRYESIDSTAIDLHDNIQQQLVVLLQEKNRFRVTAADYNPQDWLDALAAPTSARSLMLDNVWLQDYRKIEPLVQGLLAAQPTDVLILLMPLDGYTGTAVRPRGAALFAGGRSGGVMWAHAGIFANLIIINGKDGGVVRSSPLRDPWLTHRHLEQYPLQNLKGSPLFDVVTRTPTEDDMISLKEVFSDLINPGHIKAALGDAL